MTPDDRAYDLELAARLRDALTEAVNPATTEIDRLPAAEIVELMLREEARVAGAVRAEGGAIAELADIVVERLGRGGRLVYVGAGTSGRLGALDAAEIPPTFGAPPGLVSALIAGGPAALTASIEGAEDRPELGRRDVAALDVGPDDVVLGIAASGRTPYVLGAIAEGRRRGAFTAGLTVVRPSPLTEAVQLSIAPEVGPEVIAGSTRMKAGTAQKLALNALSTTVMIRLGKTFGNLMVDMTPSNAKLRARAVSIVATATGLSLPEAQALLAEAGDVKTAIVMALTGADRAEAARRLERSGGRVRAAIEPSDG